MAHQTHHRTVIDENLVFLCDLTNCTKRLLDKSMGSGILTRDECYEIERERQGYDRNRVLYEVIRRKDANKYEKLREIMESEDTRQSDDILNVLKLGISVEHSIHLEVEILQSKWWPEEKVLVNSFCERRTEKGLLIEELHLILTADSNNNTAVISQKVTVSGFGGIGKSTTAKWYAKHYMDIYDHIIWIDCGDGSLLKSFRELSYDLRIKEWTKFELKRLAKDCFLKLQDKKCLWIFDNAESYFGSDGISVVLPSSPNFHTIVTSRNCEWGNPTGLGQIPQLQMDVFTSTQSLDFMRTNLESQSLIEDLHEICDLLGNLPLALQIAVAALNEQNIPLSDYIEILKNTDHVLERKFDDYEKTINASLKASLDFIQKSTECFKELAYRVLMAFAYVRPDRIHIELFQEWERCKDYEIQGAMKLLETYSLVSTKNGTNYNIHRLLQQVIRLNHKDRASDTLRKILKSDSDYSIKETAFSFADDGLRLEFPNLTVQFIHQPELSNLVSFKKFEEALNLSVVINAPLHSSATIFNHAICLKNCKMLKDALHRFDNLLCDATKSEWCKGQDWSTELIDPVYQPTKGSIESQIFLLHLDLGNFTSAKKLFESVDKIQCAAFEQYGKLIVQYLNAKLFGETGYRIFHTWNFLTLCRRRLGIRDVVFCGCYMNESPLLPNNLETLDLNWVHADEEMSIPMFGLGTRVPHTLSVLEIKAVDQSLLISLEQLDMLRILELRNCTVVLTDAPLKMCPEKVVLDSVLFIRNGERLKEIVLNRYINLSDLEDITLRSRANVAPTYVQDKTGVYNRIDTSNHKLHTDIKIVVTGSLNVKFVELSGNCVIVENWENANWNINRFILDQVRFGKTGMTIKTFEANNTYVDLRDIPDTLDTLVLRENAKITLTGEIPLRINLNYLYVEFLPKSELHINFLLLNCPKLVGFSCTEICPTENTGKSLHLDYLPMTIKTIHLFQVRVTGERVRNIHKLVLSNYSYADVKIILTILKPTNLILVSNIDNLIEQWNLLELIEYSFVNLIVGYIRWNGDFIESPLFNYVDREGEIYRFQYQRGRAIDQREFDTYFKFPPMG